MSRDVSVSLTAQHAPAAMWQDAHQLHNLREAEWGFFDVSAHTLLDAFVEHDE